ncbi:MAG TPA: type II toxin-antitoxin system HicB family antitoxin [Chloroflexia bacterium]|nr:type II toxin-antitoxin system HicB family antitoxin [Chloroflexia bacterium]
MVDQDMHQQYSVVLEWDPIDRIYVVTVPELPGCRTHGNTREEAVKQAQDAIQSWIDDAVASDEPVPQPRMHAISA